MTVLSSTKVVSSAENLKGQHISLVGITLAVCLDVPKSVFRKPPHWKGSIYMLLTDVENKVTTIPVENLIQYHWIVQYYYLRDTIIIYILF